LRFHRCNQQVIPGTSASDIEQAPLGVVNFLQIRVITNGLDPLLKWNDFVVASHPSCFAQQWLASSTGNHRSQLLLLGLLKFRIVFNPWPSANDGVVRRWLACENFKFRHSDNPCFEDRRSVKVASARGCHTNLPETVQRLPPVP